MNRWALPFRHLLLLPHMTLPQPYAIILDDHPLVGRGMSQYLQSIHPELNVRVAALWVDVQQLIAASGCPMMLVADVWLADSNSLTALAQWRTQCPGTPWLAISGDDDPLMQQRVRSAGAQGFVHKQALPEVFGRAFATVLAGGQWYERATEPERADYLPREWTVSPGELGLTPRQGEILALVLRGLPNKRIALMLTLSESTVKEHLTGIFERLGVRSRVEILTHLRGRRIDVSPTLGTNTKREQSSTNE
jgi:DNA-binding NarL/FixJ family response regulator